VNKLSLLLANKHTTGAAVVYALCELLTIWAPDYKAQLDQTKNWALVYGLLLAGDSKPINGHTYEDKEQVPISHRNPEPPTSR
jgi:hypothetical protein